MYDVSILVRRAAELGWQQADIARKIKKLPAKERCSYATVYRVFQLRTGRPSSLRPIAKVLGFDLEDLIRDDVA